MKRIILHLLLNIKCLSIIFLTTLLCSCSANSWKYPPENSNDKISIYVVSHGWHTGIILPNHQSTSLSFLSDYFDQSIKWFEFGWGDKGFYQANEITTGLTLKAIFLPTESVMHVVGTKSDPLQSFPDSQLTELIISHKTLNVLEEFIDKSFKKDEKLNPVYLKTGLYGNSRFFVGKGNYYLFRTCNSWTARALKKSGVPISSFLKLTSDSVMDQLSAIKKVTGN